MDTLRNHQIEFTRILDQYLFLTKERFGISYVYPPKALQALELFLAQDQTPELAGARRELPERRNPFNGKQGLDAQVADYADYQRAAAKAAFAGKLVYQPLGCRKPARVPSGAPAQDCAHFRLYLAGPDGALSRPIEQ